MYITVCDKPSKCVLNTLDIVYAEVGQTSEYAISCMSSNLTVFKAVWALFSPMMPASLIRQSMGNSCDHNL